MGLGQCLEIFPEHIVSEAATGGVLYENNDLKNFANFTGQQLCCSLSLIKLQI